MKFYHDPGLNSETAGQVRKELFVKRIGAGKPGYFFNFSVSNKAEGGSSAPVQKKFSIAVTEGEMQIILALIQQSLPLLLALHIKPRYESLTEEESK